MAFTVSVPAHEQDAFGEQVDEVVTRNDTAPGSIPLSQSDQTLRDYLVRKAREIVADAAIVGERIVVSISGHANEGGDVYSGDGTPPHFTIHAEAVAPDPVPAGQQQQTSSAFGAAPVEQPAAAPAEEAAPAVEEPAAEPVADPTAGSPDAAAASSESGTSTSQSDVAAAPAEQAPFAAPAAPSAEPAADATPVTQSEPLPHWSSNVPAGGVSAEDASQHLEQAPPSSVPEGTVPDSPPAPETSGA